MSPPRYKSIDSSIKRLAQTIILQGVKDYFSQPSEGDSAAYYHWRNAKGWLLDDENMNTFSFFWCCSVLDLCPGELRRKLRDGKVEMESVRKIRFMPPSQ